MTQLSQDLEGEVGGCMRTFEDLHLLICVWSCCWCSSYITYSRSISMLSHSTPLQSIAPQNHPNHLLPLHPILLSYPPTSAHPIALLLYPPILIHLRENSQREYLRLTKELVKLLFTTVERTARRAAKTALRCKNIVVVFVLWRRGGCNCCLDGGGGGMIFW